MSIKLHVGGMHCRSCELLLKDAIEEIPKAKVLSANHRTGIIEVELGDSNSLEKVRKAIQKEGYAV